MDAGLANRLQGIDFGIVDRVGRFAEADDLVHRGNLQYR